MAKKSKDPKPKPKPETEQQEQDTSTSPPDSSNIFNKLFGSETPQAGPFTTLFSSDNPFRRKPTDAQTQQNPSQDTHIKKNEKRPILDDAVSPKPSKEPILDDGQALNIQAGNRSSSNFDLDEGNVKKKKKNKRKRDEIEREYEEKKYGVVLEEEEEKKKVVAAGKKRKGVDNPAELMVSQEEGYDDESKLLRTVFVGNLPLKLKKKVLLKEFSQFGEVESVRIRSVPTLDSKKPKKVQILNGKINGAADSVHAYIVFKTEQSAEASLGHNMSVIGGNHIRVDRACPPRKKLKEDGASAPLYSNKRTIFVGNLPFDVKDEELYQLFCGIKQLESSVEAVRVIRDPHTSVGKGIAYVLFKTREAANFACKKHNLKIRDRELRICHAKSESQSTPSKRKNPFSGENTPVKKFSSESPGSRYKVNTRGDTSYQGLRASKSSEKKKTPSRRTPTPVAARSATKTKEKVKQRTGKRPAVAARKAKANGVQGGGVSSQAGQKRKMDARTPSGSNQKKKFKKSK